MKTKLLTLCIYAFFTGSGYAQEYRPFLNNSAWNEETFSQLNGVTNSFIGNGVEEVIDGVTYTKFFDTVFNEDVYIREDVEAKKVYRRNNAVDVLLYDFSLDIDVGTFEHLGTTYSVTSVYFLPLVGGEQMRVLELSSANDIYHETWFEGVGNNAHPFRQQVDSSMDPARRITCSYQNGINVFNSGLANTGVESDCASLLAISENAVSKVQFAPNPFSDYTTITSESGLNNATAKMYNVLGEKVLEFKNTNSNKIVIQRGNLSAGIYILKLEQHGRPVTTQKLVISN